MIEVVSRSVITRILDSNTWVKEPVAARGT